MYEGDLLDEEKHGAGEYRYADGTVYSGEWHRGQRQGFGTLISPSGALYEGGLLRARAYVRACVRMQNNREYSRLLAVRCWPFCARIASEAASANTVLLLPEPVS